MSKITHLPHLAGLLLLLPLLLCSHFSHAQSVGIGTAAPNAKAALDIVSSGKGLLIPRLTAAQRTGIAAPPQGLLVYQTDAPEGFYYFGGSPAAWVFLNPAGGADNLGNHTATQFLNLQANALTGNGASIGSFNGLGVRADGGLNIGQNTNGNNIFIGYQAGAANQYGLFSGIANQFVGYQSGLNNTIGFGNWAFGYRAGPTTGNLINAGAVGYNTQVSVDNSLVLGAPLGTNSEVAVGICNAFPVYRLDVAGPVRATQYLGVSDARFKQNIRPLAGALAAVGRLRGVRYTWNELGVQRGGTAGEQQVGLVAQELEKVYPELVSTDPKGYKSVNYAQLAPVLIEAIKEQQAQIEALKQQAAAAKAETVAAQAKAAQATAATEAFEARLRRLEASSVQALR